MLTTFQSPEGAVATLTFRTAHGVDLSDSAPLRLDIGDTRVEAPLQAGPARFTDPDGTVVDQATYRLTKQAFRALVSTPTSSISVAVHDGTEYTAYPYLSGDLIE